jgi:DNA adenine methylase
MENRYIKPPFNRQGNKLPILKNIIPLIPPHNTYVELFAGSAVLFFNIPKAKKNVLNDLDEDVYDRLRLLKKAPLDTSLYRQDLNNLTNITQFYHHQKQDDTDMLYEPKEIADEILYHKIKSANGYNGVPVQAERIYQKTNPITILKNIDYYKAMMKGVIITNKDYADIIKKYDSPTTFFFIDPPYENTLKKNFYANEVVFDYEKLNDLLKSMKGKFLMTINDSSHIRKTFSEFHIKTLRVKARWEKGKNTGGLSIRKELFIMNY